MMSDIRVSWPDGSYTDLLRKSYRVAPYIVAGFAGSVDIGFRLIHNLQRVLAVPDGADPVCWRPEWVAKEWSPIAADVFTRSTAAEQALGSRILLVGVSPDKHLGVPQYPRVYLIRFAAPTFRPGFMRRGLNVCHIGSGARVDRYKRPIRRMFDLMSPTLKAEMGGPGAWATILGRNMGQLVGECPSNSVSPHVHIQTCRLGEFLTAENDTTTVFPDGRRVEFKMPRVASSVAEFEVLCKIHGRKVAAALA